MKRRLIILAVALVAAVGGSLVFTSDAKAQELPLQRADTGPRDDDPNIRPDRVPCDVRPAFAEPEC